MSLLISLMFFYKLAFWLLILLVSSFSDYSFLDILRVDVSAFSSYFRRSSTISSMVFSSSWICF